MPRRRDHLQRSAAEIHRVAIVHPVIYLKRARGVRLGVESRRQLTADRSRSKLRLRIDTRSLCVDSSEVGIHSIDFTEFPVVANVVIVLGVEKAGWILPSQRF